ncbi:hypothetical protein WPS_02320 [Vulcanimicrobium alpinum]|uniref:Mce/MlaD domain-containing protein n=1 Tax=Vulcanimicrobium alpinum TaxID=3016050 RepID=A0AAN1XV33_UNVUL|nr:MlaD family protein [Vulcanimicrobium alpinum]BDE04956.1 hypothetical protein WPS_02320 [Vulcanimicrobium alpinum]
MTDGFHDAPAPGSGAIPLVRRDRHPFAAFGALVLLLIGAALAIATLVVTRRDADVRTLSVQVASAAGVSQGDAVWLSGMRVGRVAAIALTEGRLVTIRCEVDPRIGLPPGAQVVVTTGLYGDRKVEIATRGGETPDDNALVGYVRAEEGLRSNPFDPLAAATAHLFADVSRLQNRGQGQAAATIASVARLQAAVVRLRANAGALAARGSPLVHVPSMRRAILPAPAPAMRAQLGDAVAQAQRARTHLTVARATLVDDPALRRGIEGDERAVQAALAAIRETMPRAFPHDR